MRNDEILSCFMQSGHVSCVKYYAICLFSFCALQCSNLLLENIAPD